MIFFLFGQHNKRKQIFYAGISLILLSLPALSTAEELGLDNFVVLILKNNPGVQKILAQNDIAKNTLESNKGIDDAVISSSVTASHTEPNQIFTYEPSESNDTRLSLSYDKLFSNTGTRFSLGYINQFTDRNPALASLGNQYYQPSFTLRLTQPLLKNSGGIQDRLNIELNKLNVKLTGLSSEEDLENYITQLATLYIDWYLAERELVISKEVYQQSIAQEKLTRTKVKRQVIEPYELLRAQETREEYYSRWQQAKGRYTGLSQQIRYQMNLANNSDDINLKPENPGTSRLLGKNQPLIANHIYLEQHSRLKKLLNTLQQQQIIYWMQKIMPSHLILT